MMAMNPDFQRRLPALLLGVLAATGGWQPSERKIKPRGDLCTKFGIPSFNPGEIDAVID
jgi:hypothetical protein